MSAAASGCTTDHALGGRVVLAQPTKGYRAAIDGVLLAAALDAPRGARVLDAGTGTGIAALCLARRLPGLAVTGLELDPEAAAIARANVAANGLAARLAIVDGDLLDPPASLRAAPFDQVMTNPPFHPADGHIASDPARALAKTDRLGAAAWLGACLRRLRDGGRLTLIHRADRLPELLAALVDRAGAIEIVPLWPRAERPAKRVLLRCRKGAKGPARLVPGLVLHRPDGMFTEAAQAVLRDAAALDSVLPRG